MQGKSLIGILIAFMLIFSGFAIAQEIALNLDDSNLSFIDKFDTPNLTDSENPDTSLSDSDQGKIDISDDASLVPQKSNSSSSSHKNIGETLSASSGKEPITADKREENKKNLGFTGVVKIFDDDTILMTKVYFEGTNVAVTDSLESENPEMNPPIGVIDSCVKISEPGNYYLINNIESRGTCIQIASPDVNLDCNGYSITYATAGTGRAVETSSDRTTIENCLISQANGASATSSGFSDYSAGILIANSRNSTLSGNVIKTYGFKSHGIWADSLSNSLIKENTVTSNGKESHGILIQNAGNNEIVKNQAISLGPLSDAVKIYNSSDNQIIMNKVLANWDSESAGFTIAGNSSGNLLEMNALTFGNSIAFKILSDSGSENTLKKNLIVGQLMNLAVIQRTGDTKINLIDQDIGKYDLSTEGVMLNIIKENAGRIEFLSLVKGVGDDLSNDIRLDSNLARVESEKEGLNVRALITLSNLPTISNPVVLRDGEVCQSSICTLYGQISNEANFEVSSWSSYSIGEGPSQIITETEEEVLLQESRGGRSCVTDWVCGEWSQCFLDSEGQGTQARSCAPRESVCYTDPALKPEESISCVISESETEPAGILSRITGAVVGFGREAPGLAVLVFLSIIGALYLIVALARKSYKK